MLLGALSVASLLLAGMSSHELSKREMRLPKGSPSRGDAVPPLDSARRLQPGRAARSVSTVPPAPAPSQIPARRVPAPDEGGWRRLEVQRGDSLSIIFNRLGLGAVDLGEVLSLGPKTATLKRLHPGQVLRVHLQRGGLEELVYQEGPERVLRIRRDRNGRLAAETTVSEPEVRVSMTTVSIRDSLFSAGQTAGLSDNLLMRMVEIFRWDIDFALDIREGDRFAVLYEEVFRNGKKVRDGEILAAEFINQGKQYRAVRFVNPRGRADYYSEDGRALRKAFLRTPVAFTRISSHFNLRRRHPLLHTIRAHRGVDYAAPHGTPVRATADGRVRFMGAKGGYGNTVVLAYSGNYSTLYAHLSRFAPKLRTGQSVRQGQVIGYVGSTGLATGPHLHYELLVNGVHHDPLTVKLPGALPLPAQQAAVFKTQARKRFAKLEALMLSHAGLLGHPPRDS